MGVEEYVYDMSCPRTRIKETDDMHDWGMPASRRRSSMIRTSAADRRWLGSGGQGGLKAETVAPISVECRRAPIETQPIIVHADAAESLTPHHQVRARGRQTP